MYEWLLTIHVLAAGLVFGSAAALAVIGRRLLAQGPQAFATAVPAIGAWASKVHPGAGLVLLLTGPAMVADADLSWGTPWVLIALVGILAIFAVGGAVSGRAAKQLLSELREGRGADSPDLRPLARRMLLGVTIEAVLIGLVIVDMVVKPG